MEGWALHQNQGAKVRMRSSTDLVQGSVRRLQPGIDNIFLLIALWVFCSGAVIAYRDIFSAGTVLALLLWVITWAGVLATVAVRGAINLLREQLKRLAVNVVTLALLITPYCWPVYGWLSKKAFVTLSASLIETFAEQSENSGEKFADLTLKDSGFAGYNSFTELVFDPSGEIEKPMRERSASWNRMVEHKNTLLLNEACSTDLLKVRERVYLVQIAC